LKLAIFINAKNYSKASELDEKEIKYRVDLGSSKKSIGRSYFKSDNCGIPYAITIDKESLKNNLVTIRYIDTTEQIEVKVNNYD
jgi:glycyl-tRNA synthetase